MVALAAHRLDSPLEHMTGLGRYLVQLAGGLVRRGAYDVVLVAPFDRGDAAPAWAPAPTVRIGGSRRGVLAAWTLTGRPRIDRLVPSVDLVHVADGVVAVPADVPTIYTVHDLFPLEQPAWSPRRGGLLFRGIARRLPDAAAIIVPSRVVADRLSRALPVDPARVHVVPEGVDDRFRQPRGGPVPFGLPARGYWLALGGLVARKGLITAVRALARARSDLLLVVAGPPGGTERSLRDVASRLGVLERVRFVGFVPDDDLPALLAGARAVLHPALDEGFGLVPLEAMAAGTPVLAARTGAIPEVVGDGAWLLDALDVAVWAEALDALARDDQLVADLAARGRSRARRFTWDSTVARTEEVYATCLSR